MKFFDVNIRRWLPALFSVALLFCCVFSVGCEKKTPGSEKLRGGSTAVITYDGKPVAGVFVNVENLKTGEAGGGVTDSEGRVSLSNVVRGTYRVTVNPMETEFVPPAEELVEEEVAEEEPAEEDPFAESIPQKFRSIETTTLTLEVKAGVTEYQFDLKEATPEEDKEQ